MSQFDRSAYLKQRLATLGGDKTGDILRARADKYAQLQSANKVLKDAPVAITESDNSWVGKLDLNPDGVLGNVVNGAAEATSGIARLVGHVSANVPTALANLNEMALDEEDYTAYNRFVSGKASDKDIARLTSQKQMPGMAEAMAGSPSPASTGPTVIELFEKSEDQRNIARNINKMTDLSGIVQKDERNQLQEGLSSNFRANKDNFGDGASLADNAAGVAGLVSGAVDAIGDNPRGALGYVLENVPQLAVGLLGKAGRATMAASNVGYGADLYNEGIKNYQDKNAGALPEKATRNRMQAESIAAAAVEQVSEMVGLAGIGKVGKEAKDLLRTSLFGAAKNTAKASATGLGSEALTEGYQTLLEESVKGNVASGDDIYAGAVIGGLSGGTLSGGGRALAEASRATPEHQAVRDQQLSKAAKFAAAVEAGDHTPYLDEKSKDYDPTAAVRVLYANTQKADVTPETKQKHMDSATEVVTNLEQKQSDLQSQYDSISEGGLKKTEQTLAQLESRLKATDPADTARVEALNEGIEMAKEQIAGFADVIPANTKTAAKLKVELDAVERQLASSRSVRDEIVAVESAKVKDTDIEADVALADSGDTVATSRIINLSMSSPAKLSPEAAQKLADNKSNSLKPEEREYLRAFSAARQTENSLRTMKRVSQEILAGEDKPGGNIGIAQYRSRVATAIASNSKPGAERYLGMLDKFRQDHAEKAGMVKQAFDMSVEDNVPRQVLRTPDNGGWFITTDLVSEKKRTENGGLNIHPIQSKKLAANMQVEASALDNAYTELTAAAALRFGKGAVQSDASTPATPPAPSATPAATPGKNNLPQGNVENKARPALRTGEGVAEEQQVPKKHLMAGEAKQARIDAILAKAAANPNNGGKPRAGTEDTSSPSPASATTASSLADARSGSVASSAPAAEEGKNEQEQQADAAAGQATEQQDDTSAASGAPAAEVAPAGLRVFTLKQKIEGKLNEIFLKVNPIAQFLKQELENKRFKKPRPLVHLTGFLSAWQADPKLPLQYLEEGEAVLDNNAMKAALNSLEEHLTAWVPLFDGNLSEFGGSENYKAEDLMQFLVEKTEGGVLALEENIKTAMAYSAYSWVLSQVNAPAWKTRTEIAKMHGRGKDVYLTEQGERELRTMIGFEDRVIHELGDVAVQALGLQTDANAPADLLPRLKMALGTHILMMLASPQVGLVKRSVVANEKVQGFFRLDSEGDTNADDDVATGEAPDNKHAEAFNTYVRLAREEDTKTLTGAQQRIRDANLQSRGVVDRLFGADKAPRIAGIKPVEFVQEFAKHTRQKITTMQKKVIQETMNTPHTAIPEMLELFSLLGRDTVLAIAGHRDSEENVHARNKDSIEAQNMNLENQFDQAWEMVMDPANPNGTEQEFFVEQNVWKNFRAGFANQSLNQQTSKIHRFLFSRPEWKTTIELSDTDMVNEFKVAVGMALGMKTDQQRNVRTLADFDAMLAREPEIMQAVDVIRAGVLNGDTAIWTDANKRLVQDVAADREGMMTLQALVAFATYHEAQIDSTLAAKGGETGPTSFEVTLLVGVDGKTNGPMLSHLALGAADDIEGFYALLNRGGIYSTDDGQAEHYGQWYEGDDSQDLYEDLGARIIERVKALVTPEKALWRMRKSGDKEHRNRFTLAQLQAVERVTKELIKDGKATKNMRNLTKVPLTSFAFGSSLKKSIENMQNGFIESFYSNIEKMSADGASDTEVSQYLGHINELIKLGDYKLDMPVGRMPIEGLLKLTLKPEQEVALRKAFNQVIGKSVRAEMNDYFATFMARRTQLNNTIQASYQVYEAAYASARMAEMERLMDTGEVAFRISKTKDGVETRVPRHDMTVKQENTLRESISSLLPVMHNHYSIEANDLGAGLYMAKTKVNISQSPLYRSKVYTKRKVSKMTARGVEQTPHLSSQAQTRVEQSPGVAGAAYSIHSSDSSIMHQMLAKVKGSLNVHDEGSNGVHQTREVARGLNQATAETFLSYSPAREAAFMLERVINNLAKQVRDGAISPAAVKRAIEDWTTNYNDFLPDDAQLSPEEAAKTTLRDAMQNAYMADRMRLTAYAKMKSIDQYVWEGGQFEITPAMRKQAEQRLAQLEKQGVDPQPSTTSDLAYLLEQYAEHRKTEFLVPAWVDIKRGEERDADPEGPFAPGANGTNPVAELGEPRIKADPVLKAAFEKTPVMSLKQGIDLLRGHLKGDFEQKLLSQLARTVPDGLELRYVTAATQLGGLLQAVPANGKAAGWYSVQPETGERAIYVMSPEFKHSMLTPEIMLHELTHAALYGVIQYEIEGIASGAPVTDAGALVQELEALLEQARKHVANTMSEQDAAVFAPAFENVHEFVSYGMTNSTFQSMLEGVTMESKTQGNRLVSVMRKFVESITGLIFGRKNDTMASGMQLMVQNVSGLMEAAREVNVDLGQAAVLPAQNMSGTARPMTTEAIFAALSQSQTGVTNVSPAFEARLRSLLDGVVSQLHGPFGVFKDLIATTQATDPVDIWLEAKMAGAAPFASQVLGLPLLFTEQEAFVLEQVEATVRAAISGNEGQTTVAYRELSKLHSEVAAKISKQDFINAGMDPLLHDFIFDIKVGTDGRSDYLSRFAALGLANEKFASLLGFATAMAQAKPASASFSDRLYRIFEQVLTFFAGRLTQTFAGQDADEKLESLINALVKIEVKKRHKLAQQKTAVVEHVEEVLRKGSDKARKQVEKFGNSKLFQNSRSNTVQAIGTGISMIAGDRVDLLLEGFNTLRDQHFHRRHGVIAGTVNEGRGANSTNLESHRLSREAKNNERRRKEEDDHTARFVLESFDAAGANLTPEQKHAVTQVFLRADIQSLLVQGRSLNDVLKLVSVPAALDKEIATLEASLKGNQFANFYINAADGLGLYMAGGPVKTKRLLTNAGNIARMFTTQYRSRITEAQAQAVEPIIDQLASLYALRHTDEALLKNGAAVLKAEIARTDKGNGVEMILKLHTNLQQQSKERLFRGSEALVMKGYTPEIYDPFMDVRVATEAEGKALLDQGYSPGLEVAIDPVDPDTEKKYLFSLRDGGLQRYLTGIFSYDGMKARGSRKHDGNTSLVSTHGMQNATMMARINNGKQNDVRDMLRGRIDMRVERKTEKNTFLAPVVNPSGDAVNWRYMMEASTKNSLLHRDNRFEQVMGRLAGSIISKESTSIHNRKAVEALKAQYDAEYAAKTASYIRISPLSPDADMREIWNMLPETTKQAVRDVWGREEMLVRIDLLDINFGYRKLSLANSFEKDYDERTMKERWFVEFWEHFLGEKAGLRIRQAEDIWETIVREAKDIIVVKSGITLLGNQLSNMSLLAAYGVGPRAMLHHHRIAIKGAMDHRKDSAELFRLQRALETGYTRGADLAAMNKRVAQLQDSLARNPVLQLIEAGLMPTIVEDIAGDDDLYSRRSQLTVAVQERLAKINPNVLKVAKTLYMTQDTKLYRALSYGTQLSDFVARYTLYQHLTTGKKAMTAEKAIQEASDAFINYDVPSHRILQKLNDTGLMWFTKYYLRVQKVIAHLYRENPGRAMMLLTFNSYFDWVPTVLDSAFTNRIGNPFGMGALTYPTLWDDTVIMKGLTSPFK